MIPISKSFDVEFDSEIHKNMFKLHVGLNLILGKLSDEMVIFLFFSGSTLR